MRRWRTTISSAWAPNPGRVRVFLRGSRRWRRRMEHLGPGRTASENSRPASWPWRRRTIDRINGVLLHHPPRGRMLGSATAPALDTYDSSTGRMAKDDVIEFEGTVSETLANTMFRVK